MQVVDLVALGAIAHAELDAEIDAEADEQHREGDRDQIERADHQASPSAMVIDRPISRLMNTATMMPSRPQREPQDGQHDQDGAGAC